MALLIALASSSVQIQPLRAQEERATAIEKLADFLGGALKAATGKAIPRRVRPAAPVEMLAQPAPAIVRPEREVKARLKRLQAYSVVMQDWATATAELSEQQRQALQKVAAVAVSDGQREWQQGHPDQRNAVFQQQRGLGDYFPIRFTDVQGAARAVNILQEQKKLVDLSLTTAQQTALQTAEQEREQFHRDATLGYIMNLLDEELYLTATQRETMRESVGHQVDLTGACFGFQAQNYYFDEKSITGIVKSGGAHLNALTPSQKLRAKDLASMENGSYNSEQYLSFSSEEGIDTWQDKLKEAVVTQKARLTRVIGVRVAFHRMSHQLSDQQTRRLQVAGKGAVDEVIASWKESSRKHLKSYEEQVGRFAGGNFSFGMQVPNVRQLEQNNIWKHTEESIASGVTDALTARNEARRTATAKFIVAMLDKELWLEPFQRERLLDVVRKELPSEENVEPNRRYFSEISLLCIPLFKFSRHDLTILSPHQREVWDEMKEPFNFDGNYVRAQMQNGGQMSFRIPK